MTLALVCCCVYFEREIWILYSGGVSGLSGDASSIGFRREEEGFRRVSSPFTRCVISDTCCCEIVALEM